jgi:hypothetical protein
VWEVRQPGIRLRIRYAEARVGSVGGEIAGIRLRIRYAEARVGSMGGEIAGIRLRIRYAEARLGGVGSENQVSSFGWGTFGVEHFVFQLFLHRRLRPKR